MNNRIATTTAALLLVSATLAQAQQPLTAAIAAGDDTIQDIVVTAQRFKENAQSVPIAVTAIGGESLAAQNINDLDDLARVVPGFMASASSGGSVTPFLRGVGTTLNAVGAESSTAVYIDDVYFTRLPVGLFSLKNVDQIEVLKGPQGTLFGRNSTGGVLQIITKDPSFDASVNGSIGTDNFNTPRGDVYATGALTDKLAMDIAVSGDYQARGYGRNLSTGYRTNYLDEGTVRTKLLFNATDSTKLLLSAFYTYSKTSVSGNEYPGTIAGTVYAPFVPIYPLANFYNQDGLLDAFSKAHASGLSLKVTQDLSFGTLTSVSSFLEESELLSGLSSSYFSVAPNPAYEESQLHDRVDQFTQEIRIANNLGGKFNWQAGLYFYDADSRYNPIEFSGTVFGGNLNLYSELRSESYAEFGQVSYEFVPGLKLTMGLRETSDRLSANGHTDALTPAPVTVAGPDYGHETRNKLTDRVILDYQVTPDVLTYASFNQGYKAATFGLLPFNPVPARPELINAYEVGFKSELFDRRVRLNAAAFYYDITDLQVQLVQTNNVIISNAKGAHDRGVDFDALWQVSQGLSVRLAGMYLDSKYSSYTDAPSLPPKAVVLPGQMYGNVDSPIQVDATGNYTVQAPKFTTNAGVDYTIRTSRGDLFLNADYYYNNGFYWEPDNHLRQPAYSLVSLNTKFTFNDHYAVRAFVSNLLDKEYATNAESSSGTSGDEYVPGPPRTYGAAFEFKF